MSISHALKERTFGFAVAVFKASKPLGADAAARIIQGQLVRASTGTAANYRAACRARSRRDFIAKLGVVIEEADESLFWLEFIEAAQVLKSTPELQKLRTEADELVAIFTTSQKTARANAPKSRTSDTKDD